MMDDGLNWWEEFITENPPPLTNRGLKMLVEVWECCGKPSAYKEDDPVTVDLENLPSHVSRRSAGAVRGRLLSGGFLDAVIYHDASDMPRVEEIGLSPRGFAALVAAGLLKRARDRRPRRT